MARWLWCLVLVLLVARRGEALVCDGTAVTEGQTCTMSDGVTAGTCTGGACVRTYTIPGNGPRTGTGTISSSGSAVTGSGTVFTTELHVGDLITASGQTVVVYAVSADTTLSTYPNFNPVISGGTAFTYTNPVVRYLDSSGASVAQMDPRGEQTVWGIRGPLGGVGMRLDDKLLVQPNASVFNGPIGPTPTVAVDFSASLKPTTSGVEFALLYFHPSITMSADNLDVEVIKDLATYTSNASTTTTEGVTPILIGAKATSATAGHPPVPITPVINQCIVESNGVDNSTVHGVGENTVLHQPTYQVLGSGAKLIEDDDAAVISQPLFYTDTTGQVLTVGHGAAVWAKAPVFTGSGPNATITAPRIIDIEDQTATGITYTNPPVGFADKGPNLFKQSGKARFGDQANANEQVEVLGNVLVDNAGAENGVKLKGTSTGILTVKGGSTDTRNVTLVLSPGLMGFAQANAGGM